MDIQHLVDRLEEVLNKSVRIPLTPYLMVNEDRIFSTVDQMRVTIPEEVKRANRIEAEKERILAQAKEEADRIRALAKIIAGGVIIWSLFSALTAFADGFWTLFFCRVMVGVGEATLGPAAISLIADYFSPTRRATAITRCICRCTKPGR